MKIIAVILLPFAFVGCDGNEEIKGSSTPLTLDAWQQMDENSKYELNTLERLRASAPDYHDNQKWQQFLIKEAVPNKKNND